MNTLKPGVQAVEPPAGVFDTGLVSPSGPDDDPQDLSNLYILFQNDTLALMSIS